MPSEEFHLSTITQVLPEGAELAVAIAFPEISALGSAEKEWRTTLQTKAQQLLEDPSDCPTLLLYRRQPPADVEVDEIELTVEPPRRSAAWENPVRLRLPFVRWSEQEMHLAYVPAVRILVFAPRPALLEERVRAHLRLRLTGGKKLSLRQLALVARGERLVLGRTEVRAKLKTPREAELMEPGRDEPSTLEKVAEELPPCPARVAPSPPVPPVPAPVAFELEAELDQLAQALTGPPRRSVLLVGPAGCGKTALVRELARRRRDHGLGHTRFWSTNGARLMAGQVGFGMWQERCQKMCREAARSNALLHVGHAWELLEVGRANRGEQSVASFLRPWIARGEVQVIAECAPDQLGTIERLEPHLLSVFHQVTLRERTAVQTRCILGKVFEQAPGQVLAAPAATVSGVALERLHRLHERYATYSANPGRPIRFLRNLLADRFPDKAITEEEVTTAFSRETGLPAVLLDDRVPLDLAATADWFGRRVVGQAEAVGQVLDLLALVKARLARPHKPLASLLFIGPTGTGKTEMAKALAGFLFGDAGRLVRFDLNEFSDPIAVMRLIGGAAAGGEGLLTARIREQPFSVLLLDEFEKADPGFFDLLLQLLGDGRLSDAMGRVADFRNAVIVMTSNLGAQAFQRGPAGFRAPGSMALEAKAHFTAELQKFLRPEIFNRLDAIVPFAPLSPEVVLNIAREQLQHLRHRDGLRQRAVNLHLEDGVVQYLAGRGYDVRYGARPLKRTLAREFLTPLAEALNECPAALPVDARVTVAGDRLRVAARTRLEPSARPSAETGEPVPEELVESIVLQRRRVSRLKQCSAVAALENQVTMTESFERRLAAAKWKSAQHRNNLAQLPKLRACLAGISTLMDRACDLETEALLCVYQRLPLDLPLFASEARAQEEDRRRLLREVFRLSQLAPDDIVLAIFSEHRPTLLQLVRAYHGLADELGQVVALDYFLPPAGGRSTGSKPTRETPKHRGRFLELPPDKLGGVVMHLRGELYAARFGPEAGLHVFDERNTEILGLVETRPLPFADYTLPAGIDRVGAIKAKGVPERRRYRPGEAVVEDSVLGRRPRSGLDLQALLRELVEARLHAAINGVTEGKGEGQ